MFRRRLRKGPRIALIAVTIFAVLGGMWRFVLPLFERPTFTLFVHSAEDARDPARIIVVVHASRAKAWAGLSAQPQHAEKLLWMEKIGSGETQRLFGSHAVTETELTFTPAAPLSPGELYHIVFLPPGSGEELKPASFRAGFITVTGKGRLELIHQVPAHAHSTAPAVQSVHPAGDSLPANHLKFYLTFSEPMEQGVFMERIKLLRGDGGEIAGPFRETELWSPDRKRLTLWLHPGRQKTGVNLNEDEGAVLRENESVTLLISDAWRAASGQKLGADFKRTFRVTKADHEQPDPSRWKVHPPKTATRDPLRLEFPEPLDWALLQNSISITTEARKRIAGAIEVADGGREWRFIPAGPWSAGTHRVIIDALLEDLAGNNLNGPFEKDVAVPDATARASVTELSLRID